MELYFGQSVTFIKGLVANMGDAFRDLDGFQSIAPITESIGNTGPVFRNRNLPQVSAGVENIAAPAGN